ATLERRFRGINYEETYLEQAQAFLTEGNYTEAQRTVARALAINPRSARAYDLSGQAQAKSGNRRQAKADLEQAIALYRGAGDASSATMAEGTLEALLN
ncbi:MAG: hypothetical protein AAFO06_22515, partial [Cyanobacteria bacterium J06597_16]